MFQVKYQAIGKIQIYKAIALSFRGSKVLHLETLKIVYPLSQYLILTILGLSFYCHARFEEDHSASNSVPTSP